MKEKRRGCFQKEDQKRIAAIGLVTTCLLALSVAGSIKNSRIASENSRIASENGIAAEERVREGESLAAGSAETTKENDHLKTSEEKSSDNTGQGENETSQEQENQALLSEEDKEFLDNLSDSMAKGNWEGAARLLSGYELSWKEFPCMYRDGVLTSGVSSGQGLVFMRPFTVFYGEFSKGLPQGTSTALQVMKLEEGMRYDYSYGTWDQGKMNGAGECGYNYYDGVSEEITKESVKKGLFSEDFMEGEISYTSVNQKGESTTWEFEVKEGIIVPDNRWARKEGAQGEVQYVILSQGDTDHGYTVSESAMKEPRWKNLISYQ